jgi:hypothetical protein
MAAGVTDHIWELEKIVALLEVCEAASFKATYVVYIWSGKLDLNPRPSPW